MSEEIRVTDFDGVPLQRVDMSSMPNNMVSFSVFECIICGEITNTEICYNVDKIQDPDADGPFCSVRCYIQSLLDELNMWEEFDNE